MGIKDRLFGRSETGSSAETTAAIEAPGCLHADLAERWDDPDDMGKPDRVFGYQCRSCHEHFSVEEGARLQAENEERLKATMGGR